MLTRFHKILIAALAVQVVLAVVMLAHRGGETAAKPELVLAGFDASKVTKVAVYAKDATKPIELVRQGTTWVVGSSYDYPVSGSKAGDLLASLAKMSATGPIATQASHDKQLRVGDGDFERKLVITAGGKDTTVFIGAPAGARRTAIRVGGDPRIFAVAGIGAGSIGAEPREWVDPSYVSVPKDELAKVAIEHEGTATELERDGDHWKVAIGGAPVALAAGETLDSAAIDKIVDAAATISLSTPADPKRDAQKPTATITLSRKDQKGASPAPLTIDVIADGGSYWVHDRALPRAVLVDKTRLDDVVDVTRDKLVKKPEPKSETKNAGAAAKASPTHSG